MLKKSLGLAIIASVASAGQASARDHILIVGSSTVFPFAATVAEEFGSKGQFKTPVVSVLIKSLFLPIFYPV